MTAALRRAAAPAAIAVLFALLGHRGPALVLTVIAVALFAVGVLAPSAAEALDRFVARLAVGLATLVGWVALGVVWVLTVAPAWVLSRLARRNLLRPTGTSAAHGWSPRNETDDQSGRTFVDESGLGEVVRSRLAPLRVVPLIVGWMVVAVALNYGLGWTYDEFIGSHDTPDSADDGLSGNLADLADSVAMRDQPWAEDYWAEYADLEYDYVPYVLTQVRDTDGPLVTVTDGVRRSHEPAGLDTDSAEVWFFGGGAVFGQGQRDEHTIPSAFARAAEDAGQPVRVVNFGQPGHTTWQQWQHFEQMLAVRPAPDAAVFLGGYDDIRVQLELPSPDPTHYNVIGADRSLTGDPPPTDLGELIEDYQDESVLTRLVRRAQGLVGTAGAQNADDEPTGPAAFAADLHQRARLFLDHLAERDDIDLVSVWQPAPVSGPVRDPFLEMVAASNEEVLDLTSLLNDRPEVFVDDSNLNEAGAAAVARAIYEALGSGL